MSKDICWVFRVMAGIVWSETYHALKHPKFHLQEETITETLLLRLSRRLDSSEYDFRAFTKAEEGKRTTANTNPTGADFEFWFDDSNGNRLKLRAQAKRQFPSGQYEGLDPSSNQIKFLINNCHDALPIYLFYNVKDVHDFSVAPEFHSGRNFAAPSYWGCAYSLASDVLRLSKSPNPDVLLPDRMWPWHTLVCDSTGKNTLPYRVQSALLSHMQKREKRPPASAGDRATLDEIEPIITKVHYPPSWQENSETRNPEMSEYLNERYLDGVVWIKQRNGEADD